MSNNNIEEARRLLGRLKFTPGWKVSTRGVLFLEDMHNTMRSKTPKVSDKQLAWLQSLDKQVNG